MVDLKRLNVERYYTNDESSTALTDFECFVSNLCNYGQAKYAFLRIRKETWEHLVYRITKNHIGKSEAKTLINIDFNGVVSQTIKKRFEENPVKLIDDILRSWSYDSKDYVSLIKRLINFLGDYELEIDDCLYQNLKTKSPMFKHMLMSMGISSFSKCNFDTIVEGKYDSYLELLNFKFKLLDGKELIDSFLKLLGISSVTNLRDSAKQKIKFLIDNYKQLEGIRELYRQIFGGSLNETIDKIIVNYSLKKMKALFEKYNIYRITLLRSDLDFIYILDGDIKNNRVGTKSEYVTRLNFGENIQDSIYSFFPLVEGIDEGTRTVLVDCLFVSLTPNERRIIKNSLNSDNYTKTFNSIINKMKTIYDRRIKQVLSHCLSLQDLITDFEGISAQEKKDLVDSWYQKLEEADKDKITGYIEGDIYLSQKDFEWAEKKVNNFIKNYEDTVKRKLHPISIYNLVGNKTDMSENTKRRIVDEVFGQMGEKSKKDLVDYINGLRVFSGSELCAIGNVMVNFKNLFDSYVEMVFGTVSYFATIVLFKYNVSLPVNLKFDRIYELVRTLQEKERILKTVLMMSEGDYKDFWINKVQQLFESDSSISVEQLILLYLQIIDEEIELRKEKVSL